MADKKPTWGPGNPHPLSQMKTELVWEGKYDEYGNRREVDVAGLAMPMQKIETVDQPRSEAAAAGQLDAFEKEMKDRRQDDFRNMLIWGDNKLVMASLLKEFKGKIDLIYIDPPFDVGADFTMDIPIGGENERVGKEQSTLEMIAYRDMWGKGADSYLHIMYERVALMKALLSESGFLFVHLAPAISHLVRGMMDTVFGPENFRNEIVVNRPISKNLQRQFEYIAALPQGHDVVLCYSTSSSARIPNLLIPYESKKPDGYWHRFWSGADRPTMRYELLGETPSFGQWKWSKGRALKAVKNYEDYGNSGSGKTLVDYWRDTGKTLEFIRLSESGTVENWFPPSEDKVGDTVWDDIKAYENIKDFPTQKASDLLSRIIEWSTTSDSLVADFFCGSGTTGAVAERLGRRWIMADLGRFAIHTSRKRLIDVQRNLYNDRKPYRSFDVYNLGRYERQWWQKERLQGADEEHRRIVLEFFKAEVLTKTPSPLLHGRKAGAFCHVDNIDSIFTRDEVKDVAHAVAQAGGKEVYCLAWEFEMDLRQYCLALETELGIKIKLIPIPREIMEKNRTSPPPFLEMAVLEAEPVYRGKDKDRTVDIKLTRFLPSLAEVPSKELDALKERAMRSGMDFVDFWAIDFDWHPERPFNHHWQDYRTRKDRSLKTVSDAAHAYPKKGKYTACVKVVDTFGCDTSITVEVEV
ncbi:MAG: site-specific DNA-methyltransferase [candidate division Zixibacteria bacterium]|nr:site-specific DNA-methyltransferase [candidate division Zixibacteria bacterium]